MIYSWKTLKHRVKLNKCDRKVYAYESKTQLHVLGKIESNISINDQKKKAEFLVVNIRCVSLLGCKTATELNILQSREGSCRGSLSNHVDVL